MSEWRRKARVFIRKLPVIPSGVAVIFLSHFWEWWHFKPSQYILRGLRRLKDWHMQYVRRIHKEES